MWDLWFQEFKVKWYYNIDKCNYYIKFCWCFKKFSFFTCNLFFYKNDVVGKLNIMHRFAKSLTSKEKNNLRVWCIKKGRIMQKIQIKSQISFLHQFGINWYITGHPIRSFKIIQWQTQQITVQVKVALCILVDLYLWLSIHVGW